MRCFYRYAIAILTTAGERKRAITIYSPDPCNLNCSDLSLDSKIGISNESG